MAYVFPDICVVHTSQLLLLGILLCSLLVSYYYWGYYYAPYSLAIIIGGYYYAPYSWIPLGTRAKESFSSRKNREAKIK
jgi:hypothetical protein